MNKKPKIIRPFIVTKDPMVQNLLNKFAKRSEDDNCQILFDRPKDLHLLRALTLNRPELSSDFIYPLDQEHFDEN